MTRHPSTNRSSERSPSVKPNVGSRQQVSSANVRRHVRSVIHRWDAGSSTPPTSIGRPGNESNGGQVNAEAVDEFRCRSAALPALASSTFDGAVATVTMPVTPDAGLRDDYELKLNSYDLSVDIELHDIVQRLRFEHPGGEGRRRHRRPRQGVLRRRQHPDAGDLDATATRSTSASSRTRRATAIEDASANSGQVWIAAVNGTAAGGGYELALACDEIILIDDRSSAVSLPEVPLLAVLPGTGGLTRLVDKRFVRRDLADVFATRTEGVKGQQAVDWGLVDAVAPKSSFDEVVAQRARSPARPSPDAPDDAAAITLPAARQHHDDRRRRSPLDLRRRRLRP